MIVARLPTCLALCVLVCHADADRPKSRITRLADSSIEELMQIEVTSVNKKQQKLSRSAAAVYVITQEDIRRSGMTTIPEVLRLAPGLQVARISESIWAIGIRGFNDEFSNKLLVLVDGRSIYNELSSGVYWDAQDVMLDNIERIEVIRGPGAAVWGANSVNGVINIISKSAAQTQGEYVTAGAGSAERFVGALRHGGKIGKNGFYRAHFRHGIREPLASTSGARNPRDWRNSVSGFRLDWSRSAKNSFTAIGDMYRATDSQTSIEPISSPPYSRATPAEASTSNSSIMGRWDHQISETASTQLQVSYDDFARRDRQLPLDTDTVAVDFQNNFGLGERNNLIWGGGYRSSTFDTTPAVSRLAADHVQLRLFNAFVQDELTLVPDKLSLIAGVKFEHNSFTQFEVQPTVRAIWEPSAKVSTWVSFSRAVRTPSLMENSLRTTFPLAPVNGLPLLIAINGTESFLPEIVKAYEAGQRVRLHKKVAMDASVFYNSYGQLQGIAQSAPQLIVRGGTPRLLIVGTYGNTHQGASYGGEISGTVSASDRWKVTGSYSRLQVYRNPLPGFETARETNGVRKHPFNQGQLRSYFDLSKSVQFDATVFLTDGLKGGAIPRNFRTDFRLGWRPRDLVELSIVGQRLFGPRVPEFKSDRFAEPYQLERAVFGKVTWRF